MNPSHMNPGHTDAGVGFDVDRARVRRTLKWSRYGPDVIAAWVAEMDVELAPPIRRALQEALAMGEVGYPPPDETTGLPEACAAFLTDAHGWQVDPSAVRLVGDVLRGVGAAIEAYSPAGAVVLPTPAYPPFFPLVRRARRLLVEVPLVGSDRGPALDLDGIERALQAGAGTVLLCSPHNPTGRVYSRGELTALAELADRHGARVVADEVHAPLCRSGHRHVPYASVSDAAAAHSVTVTSASKAWNLPGLKCAQVVLTAPADRASWAGVAVFDRLSASPLGIAANLAAYLEGGPWLTAVRDRLDANRTLLAELLGEHLPAVRHHPPEATYLAWLDCRALGLGDPAEEFLARGRVAVEHGTDFGAPGAGHVRLNFATSPELLAEIVERMAAAVTR